MNNKLYRVIFNESLGAWTAVQETACARGKRSRGRAAAASVVALLAIPHEAVAQAKVVLPVQSTNAARPPVVSGTATVDSSVANRLTINQTSKAAILNWDSFNIGAGGVVEFKQPDATSRALNRIWDNNPTKIDGQLKANGQVYLINRNGIQFGGGAQVNVGGLVASALDIADDNFIAGYLSLDGSGKSAFNADMTLVGAFGRNANGDIATVSNAGSMTASSGGSIFLFAPKVENSGRIATSSGQVVLAAGQKVYLSASADPRLRGVLVEVDPFVKDGKALAEASSVSNTGARGATDAAGLDAEALREQVRGIIAERGNITLAAMAVKNDGRLEVTTGKLENGSINLQARYGVQNYSTTATGTDKVNYASSGGALELGAHSTIVAGIENPSEARIQAEIDRQMAAHAVDILAKGETETAAVTASVRAATETLVRKQYAVTSGELSSLKTASINLDGETVALRSGSVIRAPGATVNISADGSRVASAAVPNPIFADGAKTGAERIVIEPGAVIDTSGLTAAGEHVGSGGELWWDFRGVAIDGATNQLSATLVSNELADSPLQRKGILFGKTVYFNLLDVPTGVLPITDLSSLLASRTISLAQAATGGGRINLNSETGIVVGEGSRLDVSGGSYSVGAARVQTTLLKYGNQWIDITKAGADLRYTDIQLRTDAVAAYQQGGNAGRVDINGTQTLIEGTLRADTTAGRYQRTPATRPTGGMLVVGDPHLDDQNADSGKQTTDFFSSGAYSSYAPGALAVGNTAKLPASFWSADPLTAPLPADGKTVISPTNLAAFADARLYASGDSAINTPLAFAAGSRLWITAIGGDISFNAGVSGAGLQLSALSDGKRVIVGDGVTLSASGQWYNDAYDLAHGQRAFDGVRWTDGGSINLQGDAVALGRASVIDVSAGAMANASGTLALGNAGSMRVASASTDTASVSLEGTLLGYAGSTAAKAGKGGSLTIEAPSIRVGDGTSSGTSELGLTAKIFDEGGFSSVALKATAGDLRVADGSQITPRRETRDMGAWQGIAGADSLSSFAKLRTLPGFVKDPFAIQLSAAAGLTTTGADLDKPIGSVYIGKGANIDAGTAGAISANARFLVDVEGHLLARGGSISLSVDERRTLGFREGQGVVLTKDASIDVSGVSLIQTNPTTGARTGNVLGGGTVSFAVTKGFVLAENGASVTLDGASGTVDVAAENRSVKVHADAGTLNVSAPEGIQFAASLSARHDASAAGGTATFTLADKDHLTLDSSLTPFPSATRELDVVGTLDAVSYDASKPPVTRDTSIVRGQVSLGALSSAGFDAVTLGANNTSYGDGVADPSGIVLQAGSSAALGRSLRLDTAHVGVAPGADVSLSAPVLRLGQTEIRKQLAMDTESGDGKLALQGSVVDIIGSIGISGVGNTTIKADTDLRFIGTHSEQGDAGTYMGELAHLNVSGSLDLSAQQVIASSLTNASVVLPDAGSHLRILQNGTRPTAPLSAGASLYFEADDIAQQGTLRAPFGRIELNGRDSVTLANGSLTSAAGEGQTIPFGTIENGTDWVYTRSSTKDLVVASPKPTVVLRGNTVAQESGSKVDLSGSGELSAFEFVPGAGGTKDVLAQAGTYAVVPGYASGVAPVDLVYGSGFDPLIGTQVKLAAGGGLAAGTYTLLPAHYALLPGAFKVSRVSGLLDLAPGYSVATPIGGAVVAGVKTITGTSIQGRTEAWLVESGAIVRTRSQYVEATGSQFFDDRASSSDTVAVQRPIDAGQLIVAATQDWRMSGLVDFSAGSYTKTDTKGNKTTVSGLGGAFDLSTDALVVGAAPGAASSGDGALHVTASQIAAVGADSVVLGGERSFNTDGTSSLAVTAATVAVQGTKLTAGEIIVAATDSLTVNDGASLSVDGRTVSRSKDFTLGVSGDGALVRVGSDSRDVIRTAAVRSAGNLTIADGTAFAGASVQFDGTANTRISEGVSVNAGALNLAANRITFGDAPTVDGIRASGPLLASLSSSVDALTLRSYTSIDFADSVTLGSSSKPLQSLTLDAARIGWTNTVEGVAQVFAQTLTVQNTTGSTLDDSAARQLAGGQGHLVLNAKGSAAPDGVLTVGKGVTSVRGFTSTELNADRGLSFSGKGGLSVAGDATVTAPVVTGQANAVNGITADGSLSLQRGGSAAMDTGAGAQITLNGKDVTLATRIEVAGGGISLQANSGNLTLSSGAEIHAPGRETSFGDTVVSTNAGAVKLASLNGDLSLQGGSVVDVGGKGNGNAGRLELSVPQGELTLDGALQAALAAEGKTAGASGGEFVLDARAVASLDTLNAKTQDFSGLRHVRARNGDLVLSSGQTLTAHDILLAADNGDVTVGGTLDARGAEGGRIELDARRALDSSGNAVGGHVNVLSGAQLLANATQAGQRGGEIHLGVSADDPAREAETGITLAAGAVLDVSGGAADPANGIAAGQGGSVVLSAPRVNNDADWNVQASTVVVRGPASVIRGTVSLSDPNVYRVILDPVTQYLDKAPSLTGSSNSTRTYNLTLPSGTDLNAGFWMTAPTSSGSAQVAALAVTVDGVTTKQSVVFVNNDGDIAAIGASVNTMNTRWVRGGTYFVRNSAAGRFYIDTRITPVSTTSVKERVVVNDPDLPVIRDAVTGKVTGIPVGTRIYFTLNAQLWSRNAAVYIPGVGVFTLTKKGGAAFANLDLSGNLLTSSLNKILVPGVTFAAQYDGTSFELLNYAGDPTPVGLRVAGLTTPTALRGIRFTSPFDISANYQLYINDLDPVSVFNSTATATAAISSSGTNTITYQDGQYLQYLGAKESVLVRNDGVTPLSTGDAVVFRTGSDSTPVGPLSVEVGSDKLGIRDAAGNAVNTLAGNHTYYAVRDGAALRLVDEANIQSRVQVDNLGADIRGADSVRLEAVKRFESPVVDTALQAQLASANKLFDSQRNAITARFDAAYAAGTAPVVAITPAFEIFSRGDMTVSDAWNFGVYGSSGFNWRFAGGNAAGALTLRAGGNLIVNASVYDGSAIATGAGRAPTSETWSMTLVSGADVDAASATALNANGVGDVLLADNVKVFTGTGNVTVSAAHNVKFGSNASIYTTGERFQQGDFQDFSAPTKFAANTTIGSTSGLASALTGGFFTHNGGDVRISAGGALLGSGDYDPSNWFFVKGAYVRIGSGAAASIDTETYSVAPAWFVAFDRFNQSAGALGGGNVFLHAGGDIVNVSAAVPSQGVVTGSGPATARVSVINGGELNVHAGGSLQDGQYLVDRGAARIDAVAAIGGTRAGDPGVKLYVGDASVKVSANADVQIASIESPTMLPQSTYVSSGAAQAGFLRYSSATSVDVRSAAGKVSLQASPEGTIQNNTALLPANLQLAALSGDVVIDGQKSDSGTSGVLNLMPSSAGQLSLLAAGNVVLVDKVKLVMADMDPASLPSPVRPFFGQTPDGAPLAGQAATRDSRVQLLTNVDGVKAGGSAYAGGLHQNDSEPVHIIANSGDVSGTFVLSKAADIEAGRDVTGLRLTAQNNGDTDVTRVVAGRDVVFPQQRDPVTQDLLPNDGGIMMYGPGQIEVRAGRNVNLGASNGIVSAGPGNNSHLPSGGATIRVVAGKPSGIDVDAFATAWLSDAEGQSALSAFLAGLSSPSTSGTAASIASPTSAAVDATLLDRFRALSESQQLAFASSLLKTRFIESYALKDTTTGYGAQWASYAAKYGQPTDPAKADAAVFDRFRYAVLWQELKLAGIEGNTIASDAKANPGKYKQEDLDFKKLYGRGYRALDLAGLGDAFKVSGDVRMVFSEIKTMAGGDVDVMAPGGSLDVGATRPLGSKPASELGLVAVEGNSNVLVHDNVNVNISRWFAIDGGNLFGWASYGNIDAGKGARTAVSSSSQRLEMDVESGRFKLVDAGGGTGSGIATIFNRPTTGGDVTLFAPNGVIDAGEAGIRSSGALALTLNVANANFIVAVGSSNVAAAPAAPSFSLAAPASDAATEAQRALSAAPPATGTPSSVLTVEIVPGAETPCADNDADGRCGAKKPAQVSLN